MRVVVRSGRGCLDNINLLDLVILEVDVVLVVGYSNVTAQRVCFCYHMPNRYLNIRVNNRGGRG